MANRANTRARKRGQSGKARRRAASPKPPTRPRYTVEDAITSAYGQTRAVTPPLRARAASGVSLAGEGSAESRTSPAGGTRHRLAAAIRSPRRTFRKIVCSKVFEFFLGPTLATVGVRGVVAVLHVEIKTLLAEAVFDAAIFILTALLVQYFGLLVIRPWVPNLRRIARMSKDADRPFLHQLATARIETTVRTIEQLVNGDFHPDPPEAMAGWFTEFFLAGGSSYLGVDSHLPSDYLSAYAWYLSAQEAVLGPDRSTGEREDCRVLVARRNDLTNDYLRNSDDYLALVKWHQQYGVSLNWIEPDQVARLRREHNLPANVDVGLWANHAVTFAQDVDGALELSMRFPSDGDEVTPSWGSLKSFAEAVRDAAKPLDENPPGLEVVDEETARKWSQYVNFEIRSGSNGRVARFLEAQLPPAPALVLDSAAGLGCETIILLRKGYSVVSNEVDGNLSRAARLYARERLHAELDLRAMLWERLAEEIAGNLRVDALLCLGNSLCLVDSADGREECLRSFFNVLKPGGRLIIDERNYPAMLAQAAAINANPLSFDFVAGDVMYRGEEIRGVPMHVSPDKVLWRLFDSKAVKRPRDLDKALLGKRNLELYPFKYGEMLARLQAVGFEHVEVFGDLKATGCIDSMPSVDALAENAFITYVAVRPG